MGKRGLPPQLYRSVSAAGPNVEVALKTFKTKRYLEFQKIITGKENKEPPQHFEILDKILGDKHKITLSNTQNSLSGSLIASYAGKYVWR